MASDNTTNTGTIYYGRFSDGQSAAAFDVDIRLGETGVEISRHGDDAVSVWPYASLATAEPLTQYSIDALLTSSVMPGASLFASEGVFARRLAERVPRLTAKAQRWSSARPWIGATVAVAALIAAINWFDLSPSHAIATWLPDRTRTAIGEEAIRSMAGDYKVCNHSKGTAALNSLVTKLSKATGVERPFKVTVIDWDLVNAFAVPGEQIIVTRAILARAESSDEIAGVIAHEMGHGLEMHPETGIVRAVGWTAGLQLMMGGQGGTLSNLGLVLAQLSYTRDAEREADQHALSILKNAGIAPRGFAAFFKRMRAKETDKDESETSAFDVFRTHPATTERIETIEAQKPYPSKPALLDDDWQALRGICKSVTGGSATPEKKDFEKKPSRPADRGDGAPGFEKRAPDGPRDTPRPKPDDTGKEIEL
jgi:beta-barrel assembly-enhancing protease